MERYGSEDYLVPRAVDDMVEALKQLGAHSFSDESDLVDSGFVMNELFNYTLAEAGVELVEVEVNPTITGRN